MIASPTIDLEDEACESHPDVRLAIFKKEVKSQHCYENKYISWFHICKQFEMLHQKLSMTMKRNDSFQESNNAFAGTFDRECLRNYVHVYTQTGKLRIVPMQITNLPELGNNLHIKVSYGKEVRRICNFYLFIIYFNSFAIKLDIYNAQ